MRLIKKLLVTIAVCSMPASAINVGDTAPLFSLSTYGGGTFDLAQQKGKVTVLLFLCYVWPPVDTIGSMVKDSIARQFGGSPVSVTGVDLWNASDIWIKRLIDSIKITFPLTENGGSIGHSYLTMPAGDAPGYMVGIVVIDKNGIVRFVQQKNSVVVSRMMYDTMVSGAASTVRSLLDTRVVRPAATIALKGRTGNSVPRCYTLSGQRIPQPMTSVRMGIVVVGRNGKGTGGVRLTKTNP